MRRSWPRFAGSSAARRAKTLSPLGNSFRQAPGAITARADVCSVADGRVLSVGAAGLAAGTGERRTITGSVPIASLPPGDYLVRVVVSVGGRPVGQSVRILRKTPSGM